MFRLGIIFLFCAAPVLAQTPLGDAKVSGTIDAEILAALKDKKVQPAAAADDAEFQRRVYLDLLGRIPTFDEAKTYWADKNPDKHERLVDQLLVHPEMATHWARLLDLGMNGRGFPELGAERTGFRRFLEKSLVENKHWDRLARDLLLPDSAAGTQPAVFFLGSRLRLLKEDQLDGMTVAVASTFFGVRMECAKCHDHPYVTEWKQEHYYGLASFLGRTQLSGANKSLTDNAVGSVSFQTKGREKKTAKLMFLDNRVLPEPKAPAGPRQALADYALVKDNAYFRGALVNRVWKQLLGKGLVEPVDQIHDGNPASHPHLFQFLADDFAANDFDLRRLLAVILHSETYRRTSAWKDKNDRPAERLFAVAAIRALSPEQLAQSFFTAVGPASTGNGKPAPSGDAMKEVERDTQAFIERYDTEADAFAATTSQALFMTYNAQTRKYLRPSAGNLMDRLMKTQGTDELADAAYVAVLLRRPSQEESRAIGEYVRTAGVTREELCQEIVWSLLNSAEFRFNH